MTKKKLGGRDVKISDMEEEKRYEKEKAVCRTNEKEMEKKRWEGRR